MLRIRAHVRQSWFDEHGSKRLAAALGDRLTERCRGQKGVMITLTYDPELCAAEGILNARQLYHAAQDGRHFRRFIERLGVLVGESLAGRWIAKLEFQKNGNIHFHFVILGLTFIPHEDLLECWGWGAVYITPITQPRLRYLCKYVGKTGYTPDWLYLEPSRGVKFIRCSPGFWGDSIPVDAPPDRQRLEGCYVTVGQAIDRARLRVDVLDRNEQHRVVHADFYTVLTLLIAAGCCTFARDGSWLVIESDIILDQDKLLDLANRRVLNRTPRPGAPPIGGAPGVYLSESGNPPNPLSDKTPDLPIWLDRALKSLCELEDDQEY